MNLQKDEIENLVIQGKYDTEIGRIFNKDYKTILKFRLKHNIPSGRSFIIQYRDESIKEGLSKGLTFVEISKIYNIPHSTIADHCKRKGYHTNWIKNSYDNALDRYKGYMLRHIKYSAKRRNLDFNLKKEDIILPKYCPILEFELTYGQSFNLPSHPTIDRIDNSKGYIKNNIMVISRLANVMKSNADFDLLNKFSKNIITLCKNQGALGDITDIFPNIEILKT